MLCRIDGMSESDEILQEDLEAAGQAFDVLAAEGWEGWERRQREAVECQRGGQEID